MFIDLRVWRRLFLMPLILGFALDSLAGDFVEVTSTTRLAQAVKLSLPHCIDNKLEIEKIKTIIKANAKTSSKYKGYRDALQSDSESELLARLAYSETLAANCPQLNTKVAPLIVDSITNRIRIRKGDVRSVVFQRDQFASSLNIYEESRYQDFLCPKDLALWSILFDKAKISMENLSKTSDYLSSDSVNYFLYMHSPKWTKAPWKLPEDEAPAAKPVQSCVRFFKNAKWK